MSQHFSPGVAAYRMAATRVHPLVAVVRLYDEALCQIRRAIQAIEARRHEESFVAVNRASTILSGLSHNLRFEKGEEIATDLMKTYNANIMALHVSYGKPDAVVRYARLSEGLAELRDAFAIAAGMRTRAEEARLASERSRPV